MRMIKEEPSYIGSHTMITFDIASYEKRYDLISMLITKWYVVKSTKSVVYMSDEDRKKRYIPAISRYVKKTRSNQ